MGFCDDARDEQSMAVGSRTAEKISKSGLEALLHPPQWPLKPWLGAD